MSGVILRVFALVAITRRKRMGTDPHRGVNLYNSKGPQSGQGLAREVAKILNLRRCDKWDETKNQRH